MSKKNNFEINDVLSIFDSLEDIKETRNIMYYHLFTDFNLKCEKNNFESFNNALTEKIRETPSHLKFTIPNNLFGDNNEKCNINNSIDYNLDVSIRKKVGLTDYNFYHHAIYYIPLEHCIIASLHTVRYLLCREKFFKPTSAYKFINCTPINSPQNFYTPGFNIIKYSKESGKQFFKFIKDFEEYNSSSFGKEISSMLNQNLPYFAKKIFNNKSDRKQCLFTYHNTDLYMQLIHYKSALKTIQSTNFKNYCISVQRLEDLIKKYIKLGTANAVELSDEISADTSKDLQELILVDKLILQYQLERYFNLSLINKLMCDVKKVNYTNADLLICFSMIPDVFNRNIYIDWALGTFNSKHIYDNYKDFPRNIDNNLVRKLGYGIAITPYQNDITISNRWRETVSYGIDYLSKVYYPYYEKYYFIHLYDYVEQKIIIKKHRKVSSEEILCEMEGMLFDYCKKIAEDKIKSLNLDTMSLYKNFTKEDQKFYIDLLKNLTLDNNDNKISETKKNSDINNPISYDKFENLFLRKFTREYFGMLPFQNCETILNKMGDIACNFTEKLIIENFIHISQNKLF